MQNLFPAWHQPAPSVPMNVLKIVVSYRRETMRTKSIFSVLVAIGFLLPSSETRADRYDDQIRALENQVVECRNRLGNAACEDLRRHNLGNIQKLYNQKQMQGYGSSYKYGSGQNQSNTGGGTTCANGVKQHWHPGSRDWKGVLKPGSMACDRH